jgi:PTS system nitrogen regulatory IIA component
MNLTEFIRPDRVLSGLRVADKAVLLNDLAKHAAPVVGLETPQIAASLSAREALGSTGVGSGIALPHGRLEGFSDIFGLFARLERPIDFAAVDGKPVDLVFLLLSPTQGQNEHLAALAAVSRRLRNPAVADAIRKARSATEIYALLTASDP